MTVVEERAASAIDEDVTALGALGDRSGPPTGSTRGAIAPADSDSPDDSPDESPVNALTVAAAAFLATSGAGWMLSGVFTGLMAKLAAIGGAAIGAGLTGLAHRRGRSSPVQFLVLPAALVFGAILMAPDATGGTANLPGLVVEALRAGGIRTPPVPFDPGWRIIVVLLTTLLGSASVAVAMGFDRPKLGVTLSAPVIAAAVLVQPRGQELASVIVALVLCGIGLSVAYGAELARDGVTSGRFEIRRLARGAVFLAVLAAVVIALSRLGVLFPEPKDQTVPPQRPTPSPPLSDRILFTAESPRNVPFRLGVLDVYDGRGWLTPPFTPELLLPLDDTKGEVPAGPYSGTPVPDTPTLTVGFHIRDLPGRGVPQIANPQSITGAGGIDYDPRAQSMRFPGRVRSGTKYSIVGPQPPGTADLINAAPPGPAVAEWLKIPAPPLEIRDVLTSIPAGIPLYERLQFVRAKLYEAVVAAGSGDPADVTPDRVVQLLERDAEASPFEIVAAEALLARWVGVPSRLGYGWHAADQAEGDTSYEIHPRHGAVWMEVWFEGFGWVPFVGTPPRAKASLTPTEVRDVPDVTSVEEVALEVHVPFRLSGVQLLFELIRYWLVRLMPLWLGLIVGWFGLPAMAKVVRRVVRRRWGTSIGPAGRVAAAYCDVRDTFNDLGLGHPSLTPIELLDVTVPDKEHRELAWLVTRGLWGDLVRDLDDEDARLAEEMARSVRKRVWGAQPGVARLVAATSRVSLRQPYSDEPPRVWPTWQPRARIRTIIRAVRRGVGSGLRQGIRLVRGLRPARSSAVLVIVVGLLATSLSGCARRFDLTGRPAGAELDLPTVPAEILGYEIRQEPDAEGLYGQIHDVAVIEQPRVFTIRQGDAVQGSLEQATLKKGVERGRDRIKRGVIDTLGGVGSFKAARIGDERLYLLTQPRFRMLLQFSNDDRSYQVLTARTGWPDGEAVFVALLQQQAGSTDGLDSRPPVLLNEINDSRRGVG